MTLLLIMLLAGTAMPPGQAPGGQAAVQEAPADPVAEAYFQFLLGRRLESEGDIDGAVAAYRKAAELDPKGAEIRAELAGLYARQDRAREALEWANAALAIDAENREANRILGLVYAALTDQPSAAQSIGVAGGSEELTRKAVEHLQRADSRDLVDPSLHYSLGRMLLRKRDYPAAVDVLRRLQDEQPGVSDAALMLADALLGQGRTEEAQKTLEAVVAEAPEFVRARVRLAELFERAGRWADAAEQYGLAVKQAPQSGEIVRRQTGALLRAGRPAAARDAIGPLTAGKSASAVDLYLLFQADRDLGDLAAAEATARRLIAAEPDGARGTHALAQVLDERRDYAAEIRLLEPAVARGRQGRLPPGQLIVLLTQLGFAHQGQGSHDRAIETFDEIRTAAPTDPTGSVYLVQAYLVAGRTSEAVALAERAIKSFPGELRLAELVAEGYRRQGEPARAVALLEPLIDGARTPSLYVTLSEMYVAEGRTDAAVEVLERGRKAFAGDRAITFQLASVLEQSGRDADAERMFRELVAEDPLNAPALNYLGYMLAERGRSLDEAVSLIRRALEREPDNAAYLDSLGWAYFKQGRLDLAEEHIRKAAKDLTTSSAVQDHLGDVLFGLDRIDEAIAAWRRALDGDGQSIERKAIEAKIRDARKQGG